MRKLGLDGLPHLYCFQRIRAWIAQITAQRLVTDQLHGSVIDGLYKVIGHLAVQLHTGPLPDYSFLKHNVIKVQIHNPIGNKQDG